jgi:uncharacterized Fe-S cluster protein YjdI
MFSVAVPEGYDGRTRNNMAKAFKKGHSDEDSLLRSARAMGATPAHYMNCDVCNSVFILHVHPFESAEEVEKLFRKQLSRDCPSHALKYEIDVNREKVIPISNPAPTLNLN